RGRERWRVHRAGRSRPAFGRRHGAREWPAASIRRDSFSAWRLPQRGASREIPLLVPPRSCRRPSLGVGNLPRPNPTECGGGRLARRPIIPIPRRKDAELALVLVCGPAGLIAAVSREPP